MPRGGSSALGPHRAEVAHVGQRVADRGHLPVEDRDEPRRRLARRTSCCPGGSRRARSSPGGESGRCSPSQRADALDRLDLARAVVLPQAQEAPHLALEVARRLAEALQARSARQSTACSSTSASTSSSPMRRRGLGRVERGRQAVVIDVARDALHDVEGRADDRRRRGRRPARAARGQRWPRARQDACLAQHVVGAGRDRRARRAAQHALPAAAAHEEGDVRVPLADGLDLELGPAPSPCASRKASSGSVTSSGTRSFAAPSSWVATTSSGART